MKCLGIGGTVEVSPLLAGAKNSVLRQELSVLIVHHNAFVKARLHKIKTPFFKGVSCYRVISISNGIRRIESFALAPVM